MDRRTYLMTGLAAVSLGVAGCSGGDETTDGDGTTADGADPTETPDEVTAPTTTDDSTPEPTDEPTPEPTDEPTPEPTAEPTDTATPEPTPESVAQVVTVAADGQLQFAPESFTISAGDTVRWEWAAGGHNVVPDETPAESDWSGSPGAPGETLSGGDTYEYTFDVAGEYSYYCNPHRSAGMDASFTVEE